MSPSAVIKSAVFTVAVVQFCLDVAPAIRMIWSVAVGIGRSVDLEDR